MTDYLKITTDSRGPEHRMAHYADMGLSIALEKFALAVIEESRDELDGIDGGWLQDKAQELGLLVLVPVAEPCEEGCRCAEYDDFPMDCLRYSEALRVKIDGGQHEPDYPRAFAIRESKAGGEICAGDPLPAVSFRVGNG